MLVGLGYRWVSSTGARGCEALRDAGQCPVKGQQGLRATQLLTEPARAVVVRQRVLSGALTVFAWVKLKFQNYR